MWVGSWLAFGVGVDTAEAKKPAAVQGPSPEVKAAWDEFGAASKAYMEALQATKVYPVQELVWGGGTKGAAFQERLDALKAESDAAEQVLMEANARLGAGQDPVAIRAVAAELQGKIAGLAPLAAKVEALRAEVAAATAPPSSVAVAELAKMDLLDLQKYFASKGWSKPDAGVGGMTIGAYETANFDVAKDGAVLNVSVTRPAASPMDGGSMKPVPPKELAARAKADGKAFLYAPAADVYVEVTPRDGGTPDQAKVVLALITP